MERQPDASDGHIGNGYGFGYGNDSDTETETGAGTGRSPISFSPFLLFDEGQGYN